jgi:hypothetical protein
MELSVDDKVEKIVESLRSAQGAGIRQATKRGRKRLTEEDATLALGQRERNKKQYYKKKENPNKRGPKPRLSDEEKEERHKELLDYHKQYYQVHKEELKKKSYTNYKNNLEMLRQMKMKENPNFKPRNRKREMIDYYTSNEGTPENSPCGTDEGTSDESDA